jgi:hypothetical protein
MDNIYDETLEVIGQMLRRKWRRLVNIAEENTL